MGLEAVESFHDVTPAVAASAQSATLSDLIRAELAPKVVAIDLEGLYPGEFLKHLGATGALAGHLSPAHGGTGGGLVDVIHTMEQVSAECMSTGFLVWAQTACAWYLENSANDNLKADMLPLLAQGKVLGGTGLSNPMKSCSAIEDIRLRAKPVPGGYLVNGTLPWVSNIDRDHVFAIGAGVDGQDGLLVALVHGDVEGLTLNRNAHFIALEGTNTFACQFKDVFVPDAAVITHPAGFADFVDRIKPGFVLSQMGMGLGLIDACIGMMRQSNRTLSHVNQFLDDQPDDLAAQLDAARAATYDLAKEVFEVRNSTRLADVLRLRIAGSELSLRAANAAMLHLGAKGYLIRNPAQRRLREAYFVAIVTPAIKHLHKELHDLESGGCRTATKECLA